MPDTDGLTTRPAHPRRPTLDAVTRETVTRVHTCEECRNPWLPGDNERWKAYWIDDGERDLLVFYCADCAEGEFGGDGCRS
jgi:RNase P subunit RPR2